MKKVEIPEELEKAVSQLCDVFLKHAGLLAHDAVSAVKSAWAQIKAIEEPQAEQK